MCSLHNNSSYRETVSSRPYAKTRGELQKTHCKTRQATEAARVSTLELAPLTFSGLRRHAWSDLLCSALICTALLYSRSRLRVCSTSKGC
jgi:hypothetical protein